jgi:hypothetical protein
MSTGWHKWGGCVFVVALVVVVFGLILALGVLGLSAKSESEEAEEDLSKLSCWWISQKVFIYSSVFAFFEHNILLRV